MVPHVEPAPYGVGGHHAEVMVLNEVRVGLNQDLLPQHGGLQHHWVQDHHGGPHVPLDHGQRLNDHALISRGLNQVLDA